MLQVKGKYIMDEQGKEVVLTGFNIGNWMMLENFMLGYPGAEQEFRNAFKKYAGEEKYTYFFEKYYEYFLGEKDIAFIRSLGMNCIRIPMNYRLFESDDRPGVYDGEMIGRLDRMVEICKKHGVYIILDMHAVQAIFPGGRLCKCEMIFSPFYWAATSMCTAWPGLSTRPTA